MPRRSQTLLPSAVRAANTSATFAVSADTNSLYILVNETVRPGAETLQVAVQIIDEGSGTYENIALFTATAAVGEYLYLVTPFVATAAGTNPQAGGNTGAATPQIVQAPVPYSVRIFVNHSSTGNHTYSLSVHEC